jgi:hypothetical protein
MSNWELIDYCADTGLSKYIGDHPDDPDGVLVRYSQDGRAIQQIIDRNKRSQNDNAGKKLGDMHKVAEIPVGVMYDWLVNHGVNCWDPNHSDAVKRLLNSSDYRYLKCRDILL